MGPELVHVGTGSFAEAEAKIHRRSPIEIVQAVPEGLRRARPGSRAMGTLARTPGPRMVAPVVGEIRPIGGEPLGVGGADGAADDLRFLVEPVRMLLP